MVSFAGQDELQGNNLMEKNICDKNSCRLCLAKFSEDKIYKAHLKYLSHKVRVQYFQDKSKFSISEDLALQIKATDNKDNCTEPDLGMKFITKTEINIPITILNKSKRDIQVLDIIQINIRTSDLIMDVKHEKRRILKPNDFFLINLHGSFENSTSFVFPIVIITQHGKEENCVNFLKELPIEVVSEYSEMTSEVSNIKTVKVKKHKTADAKIVKGQKPEGYLSYYTEKITLKKFSIPKELQSKLNDITEAHPNFIERNTINIMKPFFNKEYASALGISTILTKENFYSLMSVLLHIEENQLEIDIRDYDTTSKLQLVKGNIYELKVPGLAEARPSLLVNDSVYIREKNSDSYKYQGIVHKVLEDSVLLGFNQRFSKIFVPNKEFLVEFGFNRRTIRVEKQAVHFAKEHNIVSYFYPTAEKTSSKEYSKALTFFNPSLNEEQKMAVTNILQLKSAPYIIFGPPGTGKTVTVVESILQIWKNQPNARVLVCAPSNAATNEIAVRLLNTVPKTDIFRLIGNVYGHLQELGGKFNCLRDIVNIQTDGTYYMPSMDDILKFRILLTTLVTAARITNGGIPDGHYTHVFIDESGYATESQTLIPIAGILSNAQNKGKVTGQVILAGDPMQLGPVVHSNFAKYCGYGQSMLERLLKSCEIYKRNENCSMPYNPKYVTKLIKNYRSHKSILRPSNDLFYHKELIAAETEITKLFSDWEFLKTPDFPILFHHVQGDDLREKNSPSFFNIQEIEEVMGYLTHLLQSRVKGRQIIQDDIGVITPYRKQAEKIKQACDKKSWNKILVGSVEQFQGKEKLIVIISTVRSKNAHKFEEIDKKCHLGFVRNPKRFNVALTRSKALLIVVGNALILKKDRNWLHFIEYCVNNKSLAGRAFSLTDNEYLNE